MGVGVTVRVGGVAVGVYVGVSVTGVGEGVLVQDGIENDNMKTRTATTKPTLRIPALSIWFMMPPAMNYRVFGAIRNCDLTEEKDT